MSLAMGVGVGLDPWQQQDLIDGAGESSDWKCSACVWRSADPVPCPDHPGLPLLRPWAAFEVVEIDPRQNGKSEIEVAREIGGALILEEQLQIYSAHLFDTAMEIFLRLEQIVLGSDDLRREVKHRGSKMVGIKHSHGEEGIEFRNGCRIRFKARTGAGGRGFTCDRLGLDEAMILREAFLGATVPTLSAVPNPQLWFYGSAPDEEDPTHDGVVLGKRRNRALAGDDPSMAYFERSADWEGDPSAVPAAVLDDPRQWARANPALGTRISVEAVANERRAMGDRQFAVERLGITLWPSPDGGLWVIPRDSWIAAAEHDPANRITSTLSFALDGNPGGTWGSLAVAGLRDDKLAQFAVLEHERGVDWLVVRCGQEQKRNPRSRFVIDKRGPVAHLIPALKLAGVRLLEIDTADYGAACAQFKDVMTAMFEGQPAPRARYPHPQPELDDALAAALEKKMGDQLKWERRSSTSADISPLVAVTLAHWGASQTPPKFRIY